MNIEGSRILITGGAGFIGSHIVDKLLAEQVDDIVILDNFIRGKKQNLSEALTDKRVRIVEGSIEDIGLLKELLADIDFVFHLAALWLYECVHEPRSALAINNDGTFNVLEACIESNVRKVIFSSSASVYGDALFTPMTEEHPFNNRTMYGATKIAGEQYCRTFNEKHNLDYLGLRYMNVFGPRMDYKGAYVSVVMKVLDRIEEGQPPVIYGDGSQSYDFVYVEDVARSNILALKSDSTDAFYNIGMGEKTTINELVNILLELTGSNLKPVYKPQAEMFVTHRIGSIEKAEKDLDFKATVSLVEGLRKVVDWRASQKRR